MSENINLLVTETNNPDTINISHCSTLEMVQMINNEDKKVAFAIEKELPNIAKAIDEAAARLKNNGKMYYFGAGTSGRLGLIDASEIACTYGVEKDMVQAVVVGGLENIADASAGDEDDFELGRTEAEARKVGKNDVIVGIAASGRTPYVLGAIEKGNEMGALTIGICNNPDTLLSKTAHITIAPITGSEAIQGSTRMKAGSSQKMVLNMLSTGIMVRLGKVYKNLMINIQAVNSKIYVRAARMVSAVTGVSEERAMEVLKECDFYPKIAITAILLNCDVKKAALLLEENNGDIIKTTGK